MQHKRPSTTVPFIMFAALIVLCTTLPSRGQETTAVGRQADVQLKLEKIAARFLTACTKLDWDTLYALSAEDSSGESPVNRQRLENWELRQLIDLSAPKNSRFTLDQGRASLRMMVVVEERDWKTDRPTRIPYSFNVSFSLRGGEWKVVHFRSATGDLLREFLATKTAAEEQAMWERERELLASEEIEDVFPHIYSDHQNSPADRLERFVNVIAEKAKSTKARGHTFWWLGNEALEREQYTEAGESFRRSLKLAEDGQDTEIMAYAAAGLAKVYGHLDDESQAQLYHRRSLGIFLTQPKSYQRAIPAHRSIANIYFNTSKYNRAIEEYEKGVRLAEEAKDIGWAVVFFKDLGDCYSRLRDYPKAQGWFQKAVAAVEGRDGKPPDLHGSLGVWEIHLALGKTLEKQGDYAQALKYFDRARESSIQIKDARGVTNAFMAVGDYHLERV